MPKQKPSEQELVPIEVIERRILLIRGHRVMVDSHPAELYEVRTFRLNEAVKRNRRRFPEDFMFRLTADEAKSLRSQIAISKPGRGGRRTLPYVFTEQGVAMLSTVLNSERAIAVNIAIMRTFVRLRQILATHKELAERLAAIEKKYDQRFKVVFDILKQLMEPPPGPPKRPIGFVPPGNIVALIRVHLRLQSPSTYSTPSCFSFSLLGLSLLCTVMQLMPPD